MHHFTGFELTPRKVEYMKYISTRGERVNTSKMAVYFNVDPSTITKMIGELSESGYLTHVPYHGVTFTQKGKEYTEFLLRRHRILGLVLTHYGLSPEEACFESARFESYVSREMIDRICRSLGHPMMGVCGAIPHDRECCQLEADHLADEQKNVNTIQFDR
ncbi:metal-dependent transcriptional regulator [Methanosphaerula palustris]|uniref:Iron (Metal) dependent repressor, DtxR family n=1 Tax=Methanosphaerula palustris (strain ATCC BAA-1556 / DSM 19958 / E1-9c) TaxID=521011 RepID=B8GJA7_METPE|nr:metal-dependent transcriptional regulator [Methanosphaerula palustris]ACL16948.1 iron (metal) dependent repressor, DtxR family [Methanosphaerula palustris E1-9c]